MQEKEGCTCSWPIIIVALIVFWPVGIALLIKKVFSNRKAMLVSSGILSALGIVMYVFAGIWAICMMAFTNFSDPSNVSAFFIFLVMAIVFWIGGFVLRRSAKKIKQEAKEIKEYLSIIVNRNVRQLEAMVYITGKPYEIIHADIQKMIDKGYLKEAYIDEGLREVVLPNCAATPLDGFSPNPSEAVAVQSKVVICPCCGANNTIVGETGECEYCGSPLR